ncbi:MAG: transcription-repair coupling factor [Acidobacteriota bacterium]
MLTQRLLAPLLNDPQLQTIARKVEAGHGPVTLTGVTQNAKPFVLAALQSILQRPVLFVSASPRRLEEFTHSTAFYHRLLSSSGPERASYLPGLEPGVCSGLSAHPEILETRCLAFWRLFRSEIDILVCGPGSALGRLPDLGAVFSRVPELAPGREAGLADLVTYLLQSGYFREEPVTSIGAFSVRGGILDVFPPNRENPVRIEFFGDEIESMREFSVKAQRSIGPVGGCIPVPMREFLIEPALMQELSLYLADAFPADRYPGFHSDQIVRAGNGEVFPGSEYFLPLLRPWDESLLDVAKGFFVVLDDPAELKEAFASYRCSLEAERDELDQRGQPSLPLEQLVFSEGEFRSHLANSSYLQLDEIGAHAVSTDLTVSYPSRPARKYHGNIRQLVSEARATDPVQQTLFVQTTLGKAERLYDIFREYDLSCAAGFKPTNREGSATAAASHLETTVLVGLVSEGFELVDRSFRVVGGSDVFDEVEVLAGAGRARKARGASFLSDFRELKPGDYVVHVDHGIGRFQGVKAIASEGLNREFMVVHYQDDDRLYVPLERLDLIQKHSSAGGARPALDRLGGTTWVRTKARIKKSMRDMSEELLKLYAERQLSAGYPFSANGNWHHEFSGAFEYEETPDQIAAINDVSRDMEGKLPMDRLLCGDVGFGKTEVAMRAAFKAAYDGKQVAVLAPTTILVYQHYLRFSQRFTAFPMAVEMLSRFRSAKEQADVVARMAAGKVDIVIGTHRLLSKDVEFKDLGLLIVDEEQQFGVAHKERLRQLKKHVDTLTLTATPIPRTLHMSMMGIRDLSVIETPPRDRLAIHTTIVPFSKQVIHNSIRQELERGGQVYFVHNRVQSIYSVASMIQKIVPEARVAVGHGQMSEKELESTMLRFVKHEADVLVSTTIIENGLDIPLVNTLIVNRADRFGLAQLYQLRGRVGRSNRRAYAYFLIPPDQPLSGEARQRLAALKEFTELGAGFKIAALDLELRGAGNLLGGEQHGHINSVGFDLYCQMLERTIQEMKQGESLPEVQTQINLKTSVRIPFDYIQEETQRLRTYKRISSLRSEAETEELRLELEDRYGPIPEEVDNLLEYVRLRLLAERLLVQSIDKEKDGISVKFHEQTSVTPTKLVEVITQHPEVSVTPHGVLKFSSAGLTPNRLFAAIRALLLDLSDF